MPLNRILIVEDDHEAGELSEFTLKREGYEVVRAFDGVDGLEKALAHRPNMIILDIDMPRVDGMTLCKQLRADKSFRFVPIIMLTGSRTHPQDKISGLEMGADDYLLKPYLPQELTIRVKNLLSRTEEQLSVNPLTRLPGNHTLKTEVTSRLDNKQLVAVCYFDLDNFKAYNDIYGYHKGDDIIKSTADMINEAVKTHGNTDDCLTHIGGDDMILITTPEKAKPICEFVINKFSEAVPGYYSEKDKSEGHITSVNRKGETQTFPLMTISIAVVTNEKREFEHYARMVDILSETKKYAKSIQGNVWIKDRRKDTVVA
ncbi:MAG: response regulator [Elusimicrobiota bacterium]